MYETRSWQAGQFSCGKHLFPPSDHLRPDYDIGCAFPQRCNECDVDEFVGEVAVICVLEDGKEFKET